MMLSSDQKEFRTIHFEETELRLGLPGGCSTTHESDNDKMIVKNNNGKREFIETEINNNKVDLKLNLSTTSSGVVTQDSETGVNNKNVANLKDKLTANTTAPSVKPPAKTQVVGWPPVRSFRKNIVAVQKKATNEETDEKAISNVGSSSSAAFVKVSMDGAPYLRKVDLKLYKCYPDLSEALGKMFSSFTIGNCGSEGTKDFMNESKLMDLLNGSDYVATYEDKDGDWMLVGDVPWGMFVNSCKRLRIMKGSEAIGLAPRAVEKCKSRS